MKLLSFVLITTGINIIIGLIFRFKIEPYFEKNKLALDMLDGISYITIIFVTILMLILSNTIISIENQRNNKNN